MYSNIKRQSSTMQNCNYFCTNPINSMNNIVLTVEKTGSKRLDNLPVVMPLGSGTARFRLRTIPKPPSWKGALLLYTGFLVGSDSKESVCNAGDTVLIPGSGRLPGEGDGYQLQYSCLENSKDRGAWWATVHGVTKSQTRLSDWHIHTYSCFYAILLINKHFGVPACHMSVTSTGNSRQRPEIHPVLSLKP